MLLSLSVASIPSIAPSPEASAVMDACGIVAVAPDLEAPAELAAPAARGYEMVEVVMTEEDGDICVVEGRKLVRIFFKLFLTVVLV